MTEFSPSDRRFLPPRQANERDVDDLEAYIRATVAFALPNVTSPDEINDLVAEALVIAEEIQRETEPGDSFRQALAAQLANKLRDYWRNQHPEVRRNTRAKRRAAALGADYRPKVYMATGLAYEHGDVEHECEFAPAVDVEATADRNLYLRALANASSPEVFKEDPVMVGRLFGVASWGRLTGPQAKRAFAILHELREGEADPVKFTFRKTL